MKKSLGIIMAAATALTLSACKDEADRPENAGAYNPERLIATEVPATRLGKKFTVAVNAYCNDLPNNETYAQDCAAAAAVAMEARFECLSYPLAAGNTRSISKAVIGAGLQGNYNEFPSQYLFTQEELEAAIELDNRSFSQESFFVITDISDLDAASVNYINGLTAPESCTPA